mgnify:CR=1 FL=1
MANSTIPNCGCGFFLPHKGTIPVGEHLHMYAKKSTPIEKIIASGSSCICTISTQKEKRWFDVETETGNNFGRFANQPGVLEALCHIKEISTTPKPTMIDSDWNAKSDTVGDQLVVKEKQPFNKTHDQKKFS